MFNNRKQRIPIILFASILVCIPLLANASGYAGKQVISKVKVESSGKMAIRGSSGNWNNPDACDNSGQIILLPENNFYSEIFALAVASYLQGKTSDSWLSGCERLISSGSTYPVVRNISSE